MKTAAITFIITLFLTACSNKKAEVKSSFKLIVGSAAMEIVMKGGAFVETEDQATKIKNLLKLDAEYSTNIPFGTYKMLFVTFSGPSEKSGTIYCGSVESTTLSTETATIKVSVAQAACTNSKYQELILKLTGGVSKWDTSIFDQGKWDQ